MVSKDRISDPPLSAAALHILLSLAGRELHGYGILQEILRESEGRFRIGPGTLYDNLQRHLERGLVEECTDHPESDPRRRYYRLTRDGKDVLALEMKHLDTALRTAKARMRRLHAGAK